MGEMSCDDMLGKMSMVCGINMATGEVADGGGLCKDDCKHLHDALETAMCEVAGMGMIAPMLQGKLQEYCGAGEHSCEDMMGHMKEVCGIDVENEGKVLDTEALCNDGCTGLHDKLEKAMCKVGGRRLA